MGNSRRCGCCSLVGTNLVATLMAVQHYVLGFEMKPLGAMSVVLVLVGCGVWRG